MSESPNKLIRFWEELKRRKVFSVAVMYSGTAFIILQLVDLIAHPLHNYKEALELLEKNWELKPF